MRRNAKAIALLVQRLHTSRALHRAAGHVRAAIVAAGEGRPQVAEARVRPIEGTGVKLRFEWNGDLRVSQVFKAWDALEAAAD